MLLMIALEIMPLVKELCMETYVKLKDVADLLNRLYNEPEYQHTGETYYAGICAVKSALTNLSVTEFEASERAEWQLVNKSIFGADYKCSHCDSWASESNSGHYDKLTNFCSNCGALVIENNH